MKTSTKILLILTILIFIPNMFLTKYLLQGIVPTGNSFVLQFSTLSWVSLVFQVLFAIVSNLLFFRFLKMQNLVGVLFFSCVPLTACFAMFVSYVSSIKDMDGVTAQSVRATLNIVQSQDSYENYLWVGLATVIYVVLLFLIIYFSCRPLAKVQKVAQKLGDGRICNDELKVGGSKQFQEIEFALNKINYNYQKSENRCKQTNLDMQKTLPKQFFKFLGKNNILELELGHQVRQTATVVLCNLKTEKGDNKSLTLEENFDYINSYLKIILPLITRFEGYVDKYLGDGVLIVFAKPEQAIECCHMILKAIEAKNKKQQNILKIEPRIAMNTTDVMFGIVGEDMQKTPTIVSNVVEILGKVLEVNSFVGAKFLILKQTLNAISQNFEFLYRYAGDLILEETKIALYESLEGYPKSLKNKLVKFKNNFEEGVREFNLGNSEKAKEIFEFVLHYVPEDKVAFVYFDHAVEKIKEAN